MRRFVRWGGGPADQPPDPLEDELRAYGEHLSMPPERKAQTRAAVLTEFRRASMAPTERRPWWQSFALPRPRPIVAAAAVLLLMLSGSGLVAAQSAPGQAFYGLRTSFERMTPPWATPAQRMASNLQFLDGRLNDLQSSARSANPAAIAAAIAAYESGLQEMLQNGELPGADPGQAAHTLAQRSAELQTLLEHVPPSAQQGIANALARTNQVGEKLQQLGSAPPGQSKGGAGPASGNGQPSATPAAPGQVGPGSVDNGKGNNGQPGNGGANQGGPNGPNATPGNAPATGPSNRPGNGHGPAASPTPTPSPSPNSMSGSGHGQPGQSDPGQSGH